MPTVQTNGIETYYEDYGDGHPIVVLHGATADHQAWAEQLQPLTDTYRILLYDLRGHGKTGGSDLSQYTTDTYAKDLAGFIERLDLDQPIIVGHSLGGMVGYAFSERYTEKLSGLITVGAMTPETFSTRENIFKTIYAQVILPLIGNERVMNVVIWGNEKLTSGDSTVDMDELEQLREAHDCDLPKVSASERSKILHAAREYFTSSWSWELSELPLLMMYGENEPFIEPHADFLEDQVEHCQSMEIPEASHNAQVDNPEFIRTQLREFLEGRNPMSTASSAPGK